MDVWEYKRRVRYYETDRMGVVHHSNYLRLLEDARMDWIRDHVMNYCDMERELGIIIPAVSATEQFIDFLRYDDEFSVRMKLVNFTGVRMEFEYEIVNLTEDKVCFTGSSVHCFTRDGDYKPLSVKRKFPEIFEKFQASLEKPE